MVYIFVLSFCALYFYAIQKIRVNILLFLPPFLIYFMISALQYNVGADYPSYIYIYENQWVLERYFNSGEFFFYYANKILEYFRFPSQAIFFVFAFVQSLFIFIYFGVLKNKGYLLWLFFLFFFTVSSIYNNQLNGIRQYAALTLLPLLTVFLFDKKYIYYVLGCFVATTFHSSGILFILFPLFILMNKVMGKYCFFLFMVTLPIYMFISKYAPTLLETFDLKYSSYIDSEYFEGGSYITVITKLYYIPALLFFYYIYDSKSCNSIGIKDERYFSFLILVFSCTHWSFLMSLDIAILSRIASYFWFFIIFPLYYVALALRRSNKVVFLIYIVYIVLPYIAKVTFLAKNEYLYKSYIFN
ncbi:EpsG family protein [Aeromonas caviae]|uniref:EpsG family protein n=1 Tax=Aeromonas caviae TaxID=648 RepID=UPI00191DE98A|nr:EpsG family protein [Aeromonas caviae]MBL0530225.1 EpsG family protein [Aeromonas caviae]